MKTKLINIILIIVILLILIVPGVVNVTNEHKKSLMVVLEKQILDAAIKCKNEDVCLDDEVTLNYLINNNYINKVYDPITKEAIKDSSYVVYSENKVIFT